MGSRRSGSGAGGEERAARKRKPLAELTNAPAMLISSATASLLGKCPKSSRIEQICTRNNSTAGPDKPQHGGGRRISAHRPGSKRISPNSGSDEAELDLPMGSEVDRKGKGIANDDTKRKVSKPKRHRSARDPNPRVPHKRKGGGDGPEYALSQEFIDDKRAYFAEIDAFELLEEDASESEVE